MGLRASDGAQGFAGNGRWIGWMRDGAFLVCDAPTTGAWCLLRLYPAGKDYIVFASRQLPEESSLLQASPLHWFFLQFIVCQQSLSLCFISVRYNIRYVITVPRAVCAFPHSYSIPTRVPFVELSVCIIRSTRFYRAFPSRTSIARISYKHTWRLPLHFPDHSVTSLIYSSSSTCTR